MALDEDILVWEEGGWRQEACVETEERGGFVCSWISTSVSAGDCGEVVRSEDGGTVASEALGWVSSGSGKKCFMLETDARLTRQEAEQRCASGYSFAGGRLASIETHSERDALLDLLTTQPSAQS
eukprot:2084612-Rhodomonas_salina.1